MGKTILDYETAELLDDVNKIRIIDQTQLPGRIECIELETAKQFWDAIYLLQVRGAPAIGVFAGFAIYLLTKETSEGRYAGEQSGELRCPASCI